MMIYHFQVYTGPYRQRREVVPVADTRALSEGSLVAVVCDNCEKEPLIGCVEEVHGDDVDIVWLEGEYNRAWKTARHVNPKNRSRMVDWRDTVPKSSIILFDFELTAKKHLRKVTVENLKKLYAEYKA